MASRKKKSRLSDVERDTKGALLLVDSSCGQQYEDPFFMLYTASFFPLSRDLKDLGGLVLPIKPGPHDGHAGDLVRGK